MLTKQLEPLGPILLLISFNWITPYLYYFYPSKQYFRPSLPLNTFFILCLAWILKFFWSVVADLSTCLFINYYFKIKNKQLLTFFAKRNEWFEKTTSAQIKFNCSSMKHGRLTMTYSVTRFGEISPLCQKFKSRWQFFYSLFLIWQNMPTLAYLWH